MYVGTRQQAHLQTGQIFWKLVLAPEGSASRADVCTAPPSPGSGAPKPALADRPVPPDFLPGGSTAVTVNDQLFFILTMAIKAPTQVFLYYSLSNFGTWFSSFNQVTEHSLQSWAPPPSPRSSRRVSASGSSGTVRSLLGGLHREGRGRLDGAQVECF